MVIVIGENMSYAQTLTMLAALLPAILGTAAATLAGFIRQDNWNRYLNEGLAAAFILIAALASVFVSGKLTGNVTGDAQAIVATLTMLMSGTLRPLTLYLQSNALVLPSKAAAAVISPATPETVDPQATQPRLLSIVQPNGGSDHSG